MNILITKSQLILITKSQTTNNEYIDNKVSTNILILQSLKLIMNNGSNGSNGSLNGSAEF